jgi:hypothetical protein
MANSIEAVGKLHRITLMGETTALYKPHYVIIWTAISDLLSFELEQRKQLYKNLSCGVGQ